MKLTELPNQDPKSFEFAAFKWLVKRFASRGRLCIGLTEQNNLVAITVNGNLVDMAPDIVTLCQQISASRHTAKKQNIEKVKR